MKESIRNKLENYLSEKIISHHSVSGGCINDARILTTESQKKYFIKINSIHPDDRFEKEANGLSEIASSNVIRVPKVHLVECEFILMEFIDSSIKSHNFFEDFGRKFATMHKHFGSDFGFYEDNYIGSNPQINIAGDDEKNDWVKFYFNKRLLYQYMLAEKNGYSGEELRNSFSFLENNLEEILKSSEHKPSLLHGDLWSGNYIVDEKGNACLIDPAVYYGNREADLAMTKLFGGFDSKFYAAYNEVYPLEAGYDYRENIYKLYHVLNHINLFGSSYYTQAVNLLRYYK